MIVPVSIIRHAILVAEDGRIRDAVLSNWVRNGRYLDAGLEIGKSRWHIRITNISRIAAQKSIAYYAL